jgi:hypothetical protein
VCVSCVVLALIVCFFRVANGNAASGANQQQTGQPPMSFQQQYQQSQQQSKPPPATTTTTTAQTKQSPPPQQQQQQQSSVPPPKPTAQRKHSVAVKPNVVASPSIAPRNAQPPQPVRRPTNPPLPTSSLAPKPLPSSSSSTTTSTSTTTTTTADYDSMTLKELLALVRQRGMTDAADEAETKAELVALLLESDQQQQQANNNAIDIDGDDDNDPYASKSLVDLYRLAAQRGLADAEACETKTEVLSLLRASDANMTATVNTPSSTIAAAPIVDDTPPPPVDIEEYKTMTLRRVRGAMAERSGADEKRRAMIKVFHFVARAHV